MNLTIEEFSTLNLGLFVQFEPSSNVLIFTERNYLTCDKKLRSFDIGGIWLTRVYGVLYMCTYIAVAI